MPSLIVSRHLHMDETVAKENRNRLQHRLQIVMTRTPFKRNLLVLKEFRQTSSSEMTIHRSNDRQIFQSSKVRLQSHQLITLEMDHNQTLQEVSSMECLYLERLLIFFLFRGWQRKRWESLRISQSRLRPRRY